MLDINFINPFLGATLSVLKVQAGITAEAGKVFRKDSLNQSPSQSDITGIIGIVSDAFNGSVSISFPEATFLKVMSGMLGEDITEMSRDLLDGAGEVTNMIFGQAKVILNERGYGVKIALPQVISGKKHALNQTSKGPTVIVPFSSPAGNFFIEISLSE